MAVVKNKYEGMSKSELEKEKRVLESMIYMEKQKLTSRESEDLLRRRACYLKTLDYNLSKIREAESHLHQSGSEPDTIHKESDKPERL